MKEYKFEVYYKYDHHPSKSNLFPEEKNPEQIQEALLRFFIEIPQYIESLETTVSSSLLGGDIERRIALIKTKANREEVKKAVKQCLQDLDLRANILS